MASSRIPIFEARERVDPSFVITFVRVSACPGIAGDQRGSARGGEPADFSGRFSPLAFVAGIDVVRRQLITPPLARSQRLMAVPAVAAVGDPTVVEGRRYGATTGLMAGQTILPACHRVRDHRVWRARSWGGPGRGR